MSDEKKPSVVDLLWLIGLAVFRKESIMIVAAIVLMLFTGGATVVWAEGWANGKIDGGVGEQLKPLTGRVARVEEDVAELKRKAIEAEKRAAEADRRAANTERFALETNVNVRLIAERLKIEPVTLEPSKDGGR